MPSIEVVVSPGEYPAPTLVRLDGTTSLAFHRGEKGSKVCALRRTLPTDKKPNAPLVVGRVLQPVSLGRAFPLLE